MINTARDVEATDPRVERTREAIVEAGAELLMESGPDAITHGNVAHAARVSRTTAYKHFPTRADLLTATLDAIGRHRRTIDEISGNLRADLNDLVGELVDELEDDRHRALFATVMERAQHDETVCQVRADMVRSMRPVFDELLARAARDGQLRFGVDSTDAMSAIAGPLIFRRLMLDEPVDHDIAAELIDRFLDANAP